jgi:hypothetical protein
MIKITDKLLKEKPFILNKGSSITKYPYNSHNPHVHFNDRDSKQIRHYRIDKQNKIDKNGGSRTIVCLVCTNDNDKFPSRVNLLDNDLTNGFWWYDPEKDLLSEVDSLFEKMLFQK